ncbi:MAG TPA: hypothetical protein VMU07_02355 [Candidatus Paceibacterota bacterium]|nr:hypothetical protein [Candidatus Paceibacterota bacterium]
MRVLKSSLLVFVVLSLVSFVSAQNSSTASGGTTVNIHTTHGDPNGVGGDAGSITDAGYSAKSDCGPAGGKAGSVAKTTGSDTTGATSFKTDSGVMTGSKAGAYGDNVQVGVDVNAGQDNFGSLGDSKNGVSGGNYTEGNGSGTAQGRDAARAGIMQASQGSTTGSVTNANGVNQSTVSSQGISQTKLGLQGCQKNGNVVADGAGAINASSTSANSGASLMGTTSYNATGARQASGGQAMQGTATTSANSASAQVSSQAYTGKH